MQIPVATTWDGTPVGPEEAPVFTLGAAAAGLRVTVDAPFHGDPPPDAPPGPTWRLWEHEVCELFIAGAGEAYLEVELGPHGHHLVLSLSGVRQVAAKELPLDYRAATHGRRWRGEAVVPWGLLPPPPHRVGAFAVHGRAAARRHLSHPPLPGPKPDFHQPARFIPLTLPAWAGEVEATP